LQQGRRRSDPPWVVQDFHGLPATPDAKRPVTEGVSEMQTIESNDAISSRKEFK
jgi:hypothetical protein